MSIFDDTVDEARGRLDAIAHLLFKGNEHLEKIANKQESPIKLTRFNVISDTQLRTVAFEENVLTKIFPSISGQYTKLNHWACQFGVASLPVLYYGNDQTTWILDVPPGEGLNVKSDPNELVVPPEFNLYIKAAKAGIVTFSITGYELTI